MFQCWVLSLHKEELGIGLEMQRSLQREHKALSNRIAVTYPPRIQVYALPAPLDTPQ